LEIAQKVRDTLAGVAAASRNSTHLRTEWQRVLSFLQNEQISVEVVLWLEEDTPPTPQYEATRKRMQAVGGMLSQRLKQKLSWLTNRVFVCSISGHQYEESLDVSFL
jgi:cystathionine beta-lyase/cystathionine gamma-synthase